MHHRQNGKHTNPVRHKVRRIQRPNHALAKPRSQPGFQRIQRAGIGALRTDDFDQMHVTRRVEEVDAAKARPHINRQALGQRIDRQPRCIGSDHRIGPEVRRNLRVQIVLPVHPFGNRLDHQIALGEQRQVFVVIRSVDKLQLALVGQRCRVQLLEAIEGLLDDTVLVSILRRQVKQHNRHIGIGKVRGNLRPHHTRAQHGGFLHDQLVQAILL
jgi:hypothetical protein